MKKKLTLTIDDDVYEGIKDLPRRVSISESVSFILRILIEGLKGKSTDETVKIMTATERDREVMRYLKTKLGPVFKAEDQMVEKVKGVMRVKKNG